VGGDRERTVSRRRGDEPLARVDLSEREAGRRGVEVRVATLPMSAVLRTQTIAETQGFMDVYATMGHPDRAPELRTQEGSICHDQHNRTTTNHDRHE
jgi:hypothetical protein